jgi:hypothetical protein
MNIVYIKYWREMDEQEQGAGRYLWALEFSIDVGIDP